jgi:hypothetical protein
MGDELPNFDIPTLLPIAVAVWGTTNTVFNAVNTMNERRDTIITGYIKENELTVEHKRLILYSDWLPMAVAVAFFGLAGIALTSCLPWLLPELGLPKSKLWFGVGIGFLLAVGGVWLISGYKDFKMMKQSANTPPICAKQKQIDT